MVSGARSGTCAPSRCIRSPDVSPSRRPVEVHTPDGPLFVPAPGRCGRGPISRPEWSRPASRAGWIPPGGAPESRVGAASATYSCGRPSRSRPRRPFARRATTERRVEEGVHERLCFCRKLIDAGRSARETSSGAMAGVAYRAAPLSRRGRGEGRLARRQGVGAADASRERSGWRNDSDVGASEEKSDERSRREGGAHGRSRLLLSTESATSRPRRVL